MTRRMNTKRKILKMSAMLLLAVLIGMCAVACGQPAPDPSSASSSSVSSSSLAVSSSSRPPSNSISSDSTTSSSETSSVSVSSSSSSKASVDLSFFDNTVFIGDSLTNELFLYDVVGEAEVLAYIGINPQTIRTKAFVERGDDKLTVIEAVEGQTYDKAYVMIGANGVSWLTKKTFITQYGKFLDQLIEALPNTTIYVQSMLPVLEAKLKGEDRDITNALIIEYNEALRELVADKAAIYLDLWPALAEDDSLPAALSEPDGVHLRIGGCKRWIAYLTEIS